jgi:polyphosphate kinase
VRSRRRRQVIRLEMSSAPDPRLRDWLVQWCEVEERDVYETDGLLDSAALIHVATRPGFERLRAPEWPPQPPRDLDDHQDTFEAMRERDILLLHPYESFDPVVEFIEKAADDPDVLAIKQTLYRTSGDSPIVGALERAAEQGKQVTVLVELKARFDEAQNVRWARRLEDAGCHVIYGVAGLKTHAKMLLVVRREIHGVRHYLHMSTGNYHDRTAELYSDIGLLTCERDLGRDAAAFFNLLTGLSQEVGWSKIAIAPTGLRRRFLELVEREIEASTLDRPGLIMAKVNSLQDEGICRALYRASRAGVKVMLNVRGICCLRPGVPGVSDNIQVVSIIDRFLEHARVYYFRNGGHEELYLASADWMKRNLDRRMEALFPIHEPRLVRRLMWALDQYFHDNVKAWRMRPNGAYERVPRGEPLVRAQEVLYRDAVEAARDRAARRVQFRPLAKPE